MKHVFLSLMTFVMYAAHAQQPLVTITIPGAAVLSSDDNEVLYIGTKQDAVLKYTATGDSLGSFRAVRNGDIHSIDATNPLQVLVLYTDYNRAVVLDRMMTPKLELDLAKINIFNPGAMAQSADNQFWIYDPLRAMLLKIDNQLQTVRQSNDLRNTQSLAIQPSLMVESDQRVVMTDSNSGIYIFDRYANYVNMLEITGVSSFQLIGAQLIYQKTDTLFTFDFDTKQQQVYSSDLFKTNLGFRFLRNKVALLYADKVAVYAWPLVVE